MSDSLPPTIPRVVKASNPQSMYTTQGMISPGDQLVDPDTGLLTPISFRFFWGVFSAIQQINQRLTNAGIP